MDGTLRVWTIKQLQEWNTKGRPGVRGEEAGSAGGKAGQGQGDSLMSAEEEAELEALMDD